VNPVTPADGEEERGKGQKGSSLSASENYKKKKNDYSYRGTDSADPFGVTGRGRGGEGLCL